MKYVFFKRFFDIVLANILIVFISPFFIFIFILLHFSSKGPFFFKQIRIGRDSQKFKIYKIRTMHVKENRKIKQVFNSNKDVFFIGSILRRFKVDELPQLINIIKGEMSFIGPRPWHVSAYSNLPKKALYRLKVLPGISGLAQVNGNINLTWEERYYYDCKYIKEFSLMTDLKIIFKTFIVILLGEK